MSSTRASPCPAVQRWEDAHTCFLSALTAYMDTCTNLKNSSLAELSTNAGSLVPRIERHIASLSSFVAYQIAQTRSTLSTARNQIISPIYALPEEVLVEIFTRVIYLGADSQRQGQNRSMEQDLRSIYHRLYNLMAVCTSWRNTAVRKRGFWSIVPMIDKCKCSGQPLEEVTERSLRRSGGTSLYIAMNTSLRLPALLRPLISHGRHIRAVNIQMETGRTVKEVMSTLAIFASPEILTELSIYLKPVVGFGNLSDADYKVIKQASQHQERYNRILGSIRVLRIRGAHIDLYGVTFTNLVELRIEGIQLGHKPMLKRLLGAISSATNLQYLQLVSVSSYMDEDVLNVVDENEELAISLPNLKHVFLADLFFNDLGDIFRTFVPGDEKWELSFGDRCRVINKIGVFLRAPIEQLGILFRGFNIDTLRITGRDSGNWLDGFQLSQLLTTVPTITTLKIDNWDFYQQYWDALTRPSGLLGEGSAAFPFIYTFDICNARMFDQCGIEAMISSHNIRQLRLGGFLTSTFSEDSGEKAIMDGDSVTTWLASKVPDFRWMGCYSNSPGSSVDYWGL